MAPKRTKNGQQQLWLIEQPPPSRAGPDPMSRLPREVTEAVDELITSLGDPDLADLPLTADLAAASTAAVLQGLFVDALPRAELARALRSIVVHVGEGAEEGRPGAEACLNALTVYGGPLAGPARSALDGLVAPDGGDGAGVDLAGRAIVEDARQITYVTGEGFEIVLTLRYPDRRERPIYLCTIDAFDGPRLMAVDHSDDGVDELLAEFAQMRDEGLMEVDRVSVADALATIHQALVAVPDLTEVALDADDGDEDDEAATVILQRPFLEALVADRESGGVALDVPRVEVDPGERGRLAVSLVERVRAEQPGLVDTAEALAPAIIDFAVDRAGDPHRWPASMVVIFLETATTGRVAPDDQLAQLPDLMRSVVRWAHAHNGWPASFTADALTAIDTVRTLVAAELESRDMTAPEVFDVVRRLVGGIPADGGDLPGLLRMLGAPAGAPPLEPPVGGSHPEPFDTDNLPPDLAERAVAIAERAGSAAADLFDDEYVTLVRRATADAAGHPDRSLARGRVDIWASGVVYAVAQLNEIPGGWHGLACSASELTDRLAGSAGTITGKAREVRRLLGLDDGPVGGRRPALSRYLHSASGPAFRLALDPSLIEVGDLDDDGGLDDVTLDALGLVPARDRTTGDRGIRRRAGGAVDRGCFVLRAGLLHVRPEIWRRLRVPVGTTFGQLHQLLQLAFGWTDGHLHEFDVDGISVGPTTHAGYSVPDGDEDETDLADLLTPGSELTYTYDFGDDWQHRIVVEELQLDGEQREHGPWALLGGAMAGPPEDCGGPWGYRELLEARKSRFHPRRDEVPHLLPPGFDPKRFDLTTLNSLVREQGRRWTDD